MKKQRVLPDDTAAVSPKDEGIGIMLSSFCSRDFGYGFKLSPSQLVIVNNYRMGKKYKDENAAMEILKQKDKNPITTSPFVRSFEYGANSEGFWTYHHIVLQFEDVVDVLKALYGDSYCFLFFFDHSSGHDKLRPNGLNYNGLNVKHGGGQHVMRNSKIEKTAYIGSFEHPTKLQVGQVQSMQYQQDDTGSFYLNRAFRQELKYDQETDEYGKIRPVPHKYCGIESFRLDQYRLYRGSVSGGLRAIWYYRLKLWMEGRTMKCDVRDEFCCYRV